MGRNERSLFTQLETSFGLLTRGPQPLAADGRAIGHGLPERLIPLDELRRLLLTEDTGYQARDATLRMLLERARAEGGAAMIGLVGMVLPGLRAAARPILRANPAHAGDLEAEILTGLVAAIRTVDLERDRLAASLIGEAIGAGRQALERLNAQRQHEQSVPLLAVDPAHASNHPDLLLDQAVACGVLTPQEADLISDHRVNDTSLEELAARTGVGIAAMKKRRQRAERALLAWLEARDALRHPDAT